MAEEGVRRQRGQEQVGDGGNRQRKAKDYEKRGMSPSINSGPLTRVESRDSAEMLNFSSKSWIWEKLAKAGKGRRKNARAEKGLR